MGVQPVLLDPRPQNEAHSARDNPVESTERVQQREQQLVNPKNRAVGQLVHVRPSPSGAPEAQALIGKMRRGYDVHEEQADAAQEGALAGDPQA